MSPLIFSTLCLADPAVTGTHSLLLWVLSERRAKFLIDYRCFFCCTVVGIMSWLAGLEHLPDARVWLGGMIVMAGVGFISYGEGKRTSEDSIAAATTIPSTKDMSANSSAVSYVDMASGPDVEMGPIDNNYEEEGLGGELANEFSGRLRARSMHQQTEGSDTGNILMT